MVAPKSSIKTSRIMQAQIWWTTIVASRETSFQTSWDWASRREVEAQVLSILRLLYLSIQASSLALTPLAQYTLRTKQAASHRSWLPTRTHLASMKIIWPVSGFKWVLELCLHESQQLIKVLRGAVDGAKAGLRPSAELSSRNDTD